MKKIKDIGNIIFYSHDLNTEITVKDYLKELLCLVWVEAEGFSGKRPFGNSDWQYDVAGALIENGFDVGTIDEDGDIDCELGDVDDLITKYITEGL